MYSSEQTVTVICFVFIFLFIGGIESATYLGCFKENSIRDRLLKGEQVNFKNTLTPNKCIEHCLNNGFSYAGLQFRYECFCSHEMPSPKAAANENDCDMTCEGDEEQICGGGLRLSVYITLDQGNEKYLGCYKERSIEARLMPEHHTDLHKTLTPAICITLCREKGFNYAGLQFRYECFCSNIRPTFKSSADEKECDAKCDGDQDKICGGGFRLSVYETAETLDNFVESNYVGCFADRNGKQLNRKSTTSDRLTPELCVGFCYRKGYRYAGLQNSSECKCGNSIDKVQQLEELECNIKCPSSKLTCGGHLKNSIYQSQISDYTEDGKLVGCFTDNRDLRTLSAIQTNFEETNTPKLCLNVCLQLGYKFAGVEYGYECHCGNRRPAKNLEVAENQCESSCPGNERKKCGGNWRILVYSTENTLNTVTTTRIPTRHQTTHKPATTHRVTTKRATSQSSATTTKPKNCVKSATEVNRKLACKGELLFKDDFVNEISLDKWTYEEKMPWIPDYEFIVLQKKEKNAFVKNGKLHIKPSLLEDEFVRRGRLELNSCTGMPYSEECVRQAATFSILPPIESSRLTTKDSISFKYGVIQVRAKLPIGDWILPEIWLQPKRNSYGPSYTSGRIRIAMARGNKNLMHDSQDIGNRQLECGVLMGVGENIRGRTIIRDKIDGWYKHFHNYSLVWTPGNLQFLVDGEHQENIMTSGATLAELVEFDQNTAAAWKTGSRIAPFDQEFYLTLGVSVGGMRDFPDSSTSGGHQKPWKNMAVKAMLNFWQDRQNWKNTWDDERSTLQIEHVRITAL